MLYFPTIIYTLPHTTTILFFWNFWILWTFMAVFLFCSFICNQFLMQFLIFFLLHRRTKILDLIWFDSILVVCSMNWRPTMMMFNQPASQPATLLLLLLLMIFFCTIFYSGLVFVDFDNSTRFFCSSITTTTTTTMMIIIIISTSESKHTHAHTHIEKQIINSIQWCGYMDVDDGTTRTGCVY